MRKLLIIFILSALPLPLHAEVLNCKLTKNTAAHSDHRALDINSIEKIFIYTDQSNEFDLAIVGKSGDLKTLLSANVGYGFIEYLFSSKVKRRLPVVWTRHGNEKDFSWDGFYFDTTEQSVPSTIRIDTWKPRKPITIYDSWRFGLAEGFCDD